LRATARGSERLRETAEFCELEGGYIRGSSPYASFLCPTFFSGKRKWGEKRTYLRPVGVEPTTLAFGGQYSIQLSYGRTILRPAFLKELLQLLAPPTCPPLAEASATAGSYGRMCIYYNIEIITEK
jgi:hypothetical protein